MAENQLSVELVLSNDDAFFADLNRAEKKVRTVADEIAAMGDDARLSPEFARGIESAQREALGLQKTFSGLQSARIGNNALDPFSQSAARAQARAFALQRQLEQIERAASKTDNKTFLDAFAKDADIARGKLQQLQREALRLESFALNRPKTLGGNNGGGSGLAQGALDGAGLGALTTGAGIAAAAIGGTALALGAGIQAAREANAANRSLSASATAAGLSYSELSASARKFGDAAGISNTEAAKATAEITRLAAAAGKPQDVEKLQSGFLDVAAARGLQISELSNLFQGLISGTDDALNAVGKADPSKLAAEYAKQIGKTVEQLTEQEKVQSRINAFQEDFKLFQGANADRLASVSGQTDVAAKSIADLSTNFGVAFTSGQEFRDGLNTINGLLKLMVLNVDEVQAKLKQGLTPRQIAEQQNGLGTQAFDLFKGAVTSAVAPAFIPGDLATVGISGAFNNFNAAVFGNNDRRVRENEERIAAEKRALDTQEKVAADQKIVNDEKAARNERLAGIDALIKGTQSEGAAFVRAGEQAAAYEKQLSDLVLARIQVGLSRDLGDAEKLKRLNEIDSKQAAVVKNQLGQKLDPLLSGGGANLDSIKRANGLLAEQKELLNAADYESFATRIKDAFKSQETALRGVRNEARAFLIDGLQAADKDNPFLRLFTNLETVSERAAEKFGKFGDDFVKQMAAIERATINAEIAQTRFNSQITALKLNQEARRLEFGPIGLSGDEQRRQNTLRARVETATETADFARQAAFFRQLNSFNRNGNETAPTADLNETFNRFSNAKNGGEREQLAARGLLQLNETLREVTDLRALGGENSSEKELIAASVLGIIQRIPQDVLRNSNAPDVRNLREIAAQSLGDRQEFARQKLEDAIKQEQFGAFARKDAGEQLALLNSATGLNRSQQLKQFLSITGELAPNELGGDLRKGRIDALRESAKEETDKQAKAEERAEKLAAVMEKIDKVLTGAGIKIDPDNPVVINLTLTGDGLDITPPLQQSPQ